MESRITFWLTLGTTCAVATFGAFSAFYTELTKDDWERTGIILAVDLLGMLVTGTATFVCFLLADKGIKKLEK
jgi:hypothetical protein